MSLNITSSNPFVTPTDTATPSTAATAKGINIQVTPRPQVTISGQNVRLVPSAK